MRKIMERLKNVSRTILTSATRGVDLPAFLALKSMVTVDFSSGNADLRRRIRTHRIDADGKDRQRPC